MNRALAIEFSRVTEAAALAAYTFGLDVVIKMRRMRRQLKPCAIC